MDAELLALAAAAGSSFVGAMATDAWQSIRTRLGRLVGRGDGQIEARVLDTLDDDAGIVALDSTASRRIAAQWEGRLRDLLRDDPTAANELRDLVEHANKSVSASSHGVAAGRDLYIQASNGGLAAGVIHGSVSIGSPAIERQVRWTLANQTGARYVLTNDGNALARSVKVDAHESMPLPDRPETTDLSPGEAVTFLASPSLGTSDYTITVQWMDDDGSRRSWRYPLPMR